MQHVLGSHPDLNPDLVDGAVRLLETGAAPLAKNAKYGRLVLNFIKLYKNQVWQEILLFRVNFRLQIRLQQQESKYFHIDVIG